MYADDVRTCEINLIRMCAYSRFALQPDPYDPPVRFRLEAAAETGSWNQVQTPRVSILPVFIRVPQTHRRCGHPLTALDQKVCKAIQGKCGGGWQRVCVSCAIIWFFLRCCKDKVTQMCESIPSGRLFNVSVGLGRPLCLEGRQLHLAGSPADSQLRESQQCQRGPWRKRRQDSQGII